MKVLALILAVLFFIYASKKAPGYYHGHVGYIDTSIIGPAVPDQNEEDTNTLPPVPPDTIAPTVDRIGLIYKEYYQDATLDPKILNFATSAGGCCIYSKTISDSFAFPGYTYSMRVQLDSTDGIVGGSKRSEVNYSSKGEPSLNFERYYGQAVYFPAWYLKDQAADLFFQVHASDSNSPPVALWTQNDRVYFAFFGGSLQDLGPVPKGVWTSYTLHVVWSTTATGSIEVRVNDVPKISMTDIVTSPPGLPFGPYPKWGIYKWPWAHLDRYTSDIARRVIYFGPSYYGSELSNWASVTP